MQEEVNDLQAKLVELEAMGNKRDLEKSSVMFMQQGHQITEQTFELGSNFDLGVVRRGDYPIQNKIEISMLADYSEKNGEDILLSEGGDSELDESEVTQG